MRLALLLLLACCGGEPAKIDEETPKQPDTKKPDASKQPDVKKTDAPKQPDAKPTNAQPNLTVTLDGKAMPIQSAFAVDSGNGQVEIRVMNYAYSCKEFTEGFTTRGSEPTDFEIKLRVGKFLHKDGALGWAIRGKYLSGKAVSTTTTSQTEKQDGGDPFPPSTTIDPAPGKTSKLPLDFEFKTMNTESSSSRTAVFKGTVEVTGCGDSKFKDKDPPPPPQPGATIEIAGQSLPIAGAGIIEKTDGHRELQIATHPVKCVDGSDYTTTRADVWIKLAWDKAGKLYAITRGGYWVDWSVNQRDETLTARPNRVPRSAKEVTITLGGSAPVGEYPVVLKGNVKAIVCPTPK